MRPIRKMLDRLEPMFTRGGRFEKFGALYEMVDTFLYTPSVVAPGAPHARDALDIKRVMTFVVIAVLPAALMGMYNVGHQASLTLEAMGLPGEGWRVELLQALGAGVDPGSVGGCLLHGALYFLPIYIVTMAAGGLWEVIFAATRNHEVNEGFLVTSMLFALTLPPAIPLWQVALGISFGVVIGKEVFGGTGKNFLNPALVGRAFLFFAYPGEMSGDVWVAVDGYTGATALALASTGGVEAIQAAGISWTDAFIGNLPGSIGETSALACLAGALFLVYTGVASWRIMVSVLLGMILTTLLFNAVGSADNPFYDVPWYWHAVLGGYAFGLVFMATDPVSAAMTDTGRWLYGLLIGFMVSLIRVVNPAYPEGMMLAILFGNALAPLIDYGVVQANVRRRARRDAA
ncbi:MAG: nqrB [Proteobacteria bacterium]|nr:nqrB [Pseudomonadota bacterium]